MTITGQNKNFREWSRTHFNFRSEIHSQTAHRETCYVVRQIDVNVAEQQVSPKRRHILASEPLFSNPHMAHEISLQCSQKPVTGPYHEQLTPKSTFPI